MRSFCPFISSSRSPSVDLWSPSCASSSSSSPSTSKSNNTSTAAVHAASLVDPLTHSSELLQLLDIELSPPVIEYVVDRVSEAVNNALVSGGVESFTWSSLSRSRFTSWVSTVLSRAEITLPTVLVALGYLDRAAPELCIARQDWAHERIFLGILVCASKYTNDASLKNAHWAICTGVFGRRDIGRIEREMLDVLEWRLGVREADVLAHRKGLMRAAGASVRTPIARQRPQHQRTSSTSSNGSLPGLSPPSSPESSPSVSPRTPPLHLPDVPMDVGDEVYDLPAKNGRAFVQMRSLRPVPVRAPPLPPRCPV